VTFAREGEIFNIYLYIYFGVLIIHLTDKKQQPGYLLNSQPFFFYFENKKKKFNKTFL